MSDHLDYEINKELGECYLFMGELDRAEEYYNKAAASNGVHPDPYLGLATIAVQRGDLGAAWTLYSKANAVCPGDKSLSGMALVEMETSRESEAFDHFEQALRLNPENMVALFGLVRLGHAMGRIAEAVPFLESYLDLDPHKNEIRFSLAGCLFRMNRNGEAVEHLLRILENDPTNASAQELLGQAQAA